MPGSRSCQSSGRRGGKKRNERGKRSAEQARQNNSRPRPSLFLPLFSAHRRGGAADAPRRTACMCSSLWLLPRAGEGEHGSENIGKEKDDKNAYKHPRTFFLSFFPSSPAATCRLAEGAAGCFFAYVRAHVSRGETESERGKHRGRKLTGINITIHISPLLLYPLFQHLSSHFHPPPFPHITRSSIYQVQPEQRSRPPTQARRSAVAFSFRSSLPSTVRVFLRRHPSRPSVRAFQTRDWLCRCIT